VDGNADVVAVVVVVVALLDGALLSLELQPTVSVLRAIAEAIPAATAKR
jgi:hypothetical protein